MPQQIYDEEYQLMQKIGQDLQDKWYYILRKLPDTPLHNSTARRMIEVWHDEAVTRFNDIGWKVEVDITPALAGVGVPVINVVAPVTEREFDHEKKASEIRKSRELGGD